MSRKGKSQTEPTDQPVSQGAVEHAGQPEPESPSSSAKGRARKGDFDPLYLEQVYPEPAEIFSFKPASLPELKSKAIVIFDTSALLLPYEVSKNSIAKMDAVLTTLVKEGRLAIPAQVAREFAKNRFDKIMLCSKYLDNKIDHFKEYHWENRPVLLESLPEYDKLKEAAGQFNEHVKRARNEFYQAKTAILERICGDPVSELYRKHFAKNVIVDAAIDRSDLIEDNNRRNTHSLAPGFEDSTKPCGGIGDKIIWHCILSIGKSMGKPAILVTNDTKKDVCHRMDEKYIYPKYELIDEYRRASNGQTFHVMLLSSLIELMTDDSAAAAEIRKTEEIQRNEFSWPKTDLSLKPSISGGDLSEALDAFREMYEGHDTDRARVARAAMEKVIAGQSNFAKDSSPWSLFSLASMISNSGNLPPRRLHPAYEPSGMGVIPPDSPKSSD